MALWVFPLLALLQLTRPLPTAALVTRAEGCGSDPLEDLSSSRRELKYGKADEDRPFCRKLQAYYVNGCFTDSEFELWERIGKRYCNLDISTVHFRQRTARKLLLQLTNKSSRMSKGNMKMVVAISGTFLVCCAFMCPWFRARRKDAVHNPLPKDSSSMDSVTSFGVSSTSERHLTSPRHPASPLRVPPSPSRFSASPQLSRVVSIHLNMSEVNKATRNFSPSMKIGEGGFGTVYKGQLRDGQVVAIKRAKKDHFETTRSEFSSEIELLAKIEHLNLVKLLGYVDKGNERVIITEYVPNGTLREHLDGLHGKVLDFNQRLEIAIDVAHALTYLHLYAGKPIIHRDVKSSNILLTESLRAKVADFGFARLGPTDADQTHVSTKVKGTAGYLDPEYLKTYQLTTKSDVYSFGILLVEILSARRPVELNRTAEERITIRWAFKKCNEGNLKELMDPLMEEEVDTDILSKIFNMAFQCAAPVRSDRPTMQEVAVQLWEVRNDYSRSLRRGWK